MDSIKWSKTYHEDVGTSDESGHADYGYYYHIYAFVLPDKQTIKVRRYTDTPDQCSIYFPVDDLEKRNDPVSQKTKTYLYAIVDFLLTKEGVKKANFFNRGYKPIDPDKVKKFGTKVVFEKSGSGNTK